LDLKYAVALVSKGREGLREMASIAMESEAGMCTNILVGNFMVFCTEPQLCREILIGEGSYGVYAHPNAIWLFDPDNLIYLEKEPHKKFRAIYYLSNWAWVTLSGVASNRGN
jgi:hypothetical protein